MIGILVSFVKVPLLLNYLDSERYGIWITLTLIFSWFSLFNLGLGNGLRNRLAECLAVEDLEKGKVYVSTTYAILAVIFAAVYALFYVVNTQLDWSVILNTDPAMRSELGLLVAIVFFFFCVRFVSSLIETVARAHQEPWIAELIAVSGNACALLSIWTLLNLANENSLVVLGLFLSSMPVLISLTVSIVLYLTRYKKVRPSFSRIRIARIRDVMGLGIKFFVVQIAAVVFYQTNAVIIARLFGPEQVTPYQIAYAYFNYGIMGFIILVNPFWTAITDAYTKGEFEWIKNAMRNLRIAWIGFVCVIFIQFAIHDIFIHWWVGDSVNVPFLLAVALAVYFCLYANNTLLGMFLNGTGKLFIQMWRTGIMALLHIPVTIYFARVYGITGVMYGMIIWGAITFLIYEIQYRKLISNTAKGIWNR